MFTSLAPYTTPRKRHKHTTHSLSRIYAHARTCMQHSHTPGIYTHTWNIHAVWWHTSSCPLIFQKISAIIHTYILIYKHTYLYTYTRAIIQTSIHTYIHTNTLTHIHSYIHTDRPTDIRTHKCTDNQTYWHAYMCTHQFLHEKVISIRTLLWSDYTYTHQHADTHTHNTRKYTRVRTHTNRHTHIKNTHTHITHMNAQTNTNTRTHIRELAAKMWRATTWTGNSKSSDFDLKERPVGEELALKQTCDMCDATNMDELCYMNEVRDMTLYICIYITSWMSRITCRARVLQRCATSHMHASFAYMWYDSFKPHQ